MPTQFPAGNDSVPGLSAGDDVARRNVADAIIALEAYVLSHSGGLPAGLSWDNVTKTLTLDDDENGTTTIVAIDTGTQLALAAADGDATHVGGELTLQSGTSTGQGGGQLNIVAGDDNGDGDGGPIVITAGLSDGAGDGGDISITGGAAQTDGTGGEVIIAGGLSVDADGGGLTFSSGSASNDGDGGTLALYGGTAGGTGHGGNIEIAPGDSSAGTKGTVSIYSADYGQGLVISNTALAVLASLILSSLPTTDPNVAGAVYSMDGGGLAAELAAGSRYLLISNGP